MSSNVKLLEKEINGRKRERKETERENVRKKKGNERGKLKKQKSKA